MSDATRTANSSSHPEFAPPGAGPTTSGGPQGKRLIRLLVLLGVLSVMLLVWRPASHVDRQGTSHPSVGRRLDWVAVSPLLNSTAPLEANDVRGKVVLLNFWGPWCPPCREEFPKLLSLRQSFESNNAPIRFVLVACESSPDEPPAELLALAESYLKELGNQPPIYVDPDARLRRGLVRTAELTDFGYPTTVLLDGQGVIRGLWVGYFEGEETAIHAAIRKALAAEESRP